MTKAAKSVYYFSFYLFVLALFILTIPNQLLGIFHFPPVNDVWFRVVGVTAAVIGFYYNRTAANNLQAFLPFTVITRVSVFFIFLFFVIMKWVGPQLIIFGMADLFGGLWTGYLLQKESKVKRSNN